MDADFAIQRRFDIGQRQVFVIDSGLTPAMVAMMQSIAARMPFRRTETDREESRQRAMVANFDEGKLDRATFIARIFDITTTLFTAEPLMIDRVHLNNNFYSDMAYPHRDSIDGGESVTAILYANHRWDKDWGGETLFYDEFDEAVACVSPKSGRLVIFQQPDRAQGLCAIPRVL